MKDVLKLITNNKNVQVYYKVACDDRRATDLQTDYHFDLQETEELNIILGICNTNRYNYDLIIEYWCEQQQEVVDFIEIVQNNYKNN